MLPSGEKKDVPKFEQAELELLNRPYRDWSTIGYAESVIDRVMIRVGSYQDNKRLTLCPKRVETLKCRLFSGLAPMSGERWRQKHLDDPVNYELAEEFFDEIRLVFQYLNSNGVCNDLRDTFNLIHAEFSEFETAATAHLGRPASPYAKLWTEFIRNWYTVMTTRTHSWIQARTNELLEKAKANLDAVRPGTTKEAGIANTIFMMQSQTLNMALGRADWSIYLEMDGYAGCDMPNEPVLTYKERETAYETRVGQSGVWENTKSISRSPEDQDSGFWNRDIVLGAHNESTVARAKVREELRGVPKPLGPEPWIQRLLTLESEASSADDAPPKYGFVAYRLFYGPSTDEWNVFVERLNDDLKNWGEWIDSSERIKDRLSLHFIDGRDVGIAESDVKAATEHFNQFKNSPEFPNGMESNNFVVVDSWSYASYKTPPQPATEYPPFGDNGGFVLMVEATFDPNDPEAHLDEAPGYKGQLRVLGNLLWSDVYSQTMYGSDCIQSLSPLALLHPSRVYTGTVVESQLRSWEQGRALRAAMLPAFFQFVKEKQQEGQQEGEQGGATSS